VASASFLASLVVQPSDSGHSEALKPDDKIEGGQHRN
jgi:hypothetical protein